VFVFHVSGRPTDTGKAGCGTWSACDSQDVINLYNSTAKERDDDFVFGVSL